MPFPLCVTRRPIWRTYCKSPWNVVAPDWFISGHFRGPCTCLPESITLSTHSSFQPNLLHFCIVRVSDSFCPAVPVAILQLRPAFLLSKSTRVVPDASRVDLTTPLCLSGKPC